MVRSVDLSMWILGNEKRMDVAIWRSSRTVLDLYLRGGEEFLSIF